MQWQTYHLFHLKESQDVILLGDSSCLIGLRPNLIMERTGLKAWNLGTVGVMGVVGHQRILETYVSLYGAPKLVVYHVSYYPLETPPLAITTTNYLKRFERLVAGETAPASWLPSEAWRPIATKALIEFFFEDDLLNRNRGAYMSDNEVRKNLWILRGAMVEPGPPHGMEGQPEKAFVFSLDRDAGEEIKNLFHYCESIGSDILFMIEPLPELSNNDATFEAYGEVEEALLKLKRPYDRVTIFRPFVRTYPNNYVNTFTHLLDPGAIRNTTELIAWINEEYPESMASIHADRLQDQPHFD
jgi:hypothetical protein